MCRVLRFVLFSIALCGSADGYARTELLKTQPGSIVHWSSPVITVGLDASAGSRTVAPHDVATALARATQTWNGVRAQQPIFSVVDNTDRDVTVRFCKGRWRGDTIDLGKSKFTASLHDGTVTTATIEINECDHTFAAPDQSANANYDLQAVLTHELGHVLGLGHSDNRTAIMYPSGGGASVQAPHLEDQTTLALIYLGRGGAEAATRPGPPHGSAAHASVDESLRSRTFDQAGAVSADAAAPRSLPANAISLLNLKRSKGRDVTVYTNEPTLLPPMQAAPVGHRHPSGRPVKKTTRNPDR